MLHLWQFWNIKSMKFIIIKLLIQFLSVQQKFSSIPCFLLLKLQNLSLSQQTLQIVTFSKFQKKSKLFYILLPINDSSIQTLNCNRDTWPQENIIRQMSESIQRSKHHWTRPFKDTSLKYIKIHTCLNGNRAVRWQYNTSKGLSLTANNLLPHSLM